MNRPPKPAELNKASRQERSQVPRDKLREHVRATATAATSEQEFFDQLRTAGLLLRLRVSGTNQVTGYAVALPDHHSAARRAIWYGGATLAHDLTLGQLRCHWHEQQLGT